MLPPPPEVALINPDAALLLRGGEDEDVEVTRESFAIQHSELASLHAEVRPHDGSSHGIRNHIQALPYSSHCIACIHGM